MILLPELLLELKGSKIRALNLYVAAYSQLQRGSPFQDFIRYLASDDTLPGGPSKSTVEKVKQLLGKQEALPWRDLLKMSVFSICTILSEFKNKCESSIRSLCMTVSADFCCGYQQE